MIERRYFRIPDDATYEDIRGQLDDAWGHPDAVTATCVDPAAVAPRDALGAILLAVDVQFCGYPIAAQMLPQLLASGAVQEITAEAYRSGLEAPSPVS
jgi:hypothetical protein